MATDAEIIAAMSKKIKELERQRAELVDFINHKEWRFEHFSSEYTDIKDNASGYADAFKEVKEFINNQK